MTLNPNIEVKSWISKHLECPICKLLIYIPETKLPQFQEEGDTFAFNKMERHMKEHSINAIIDCFDDIVYKQLEKIREERLS
jgi:hypothetical protein